MLLATNSFAQRAAISSDALKWGLASPNVTAAIAMTSRLTLDVEFSANPFGELYGDGRAQHIALSPAVLYWLQRPFYSHSIGVNMVGSIYDMSALGKSARGRMAALGVVYGYGFILGERWALTPTVGYGYGIFKNANSGKVSYQPTITKLGINFSYIID